MTVRAASSGNYPVARSHLEWLYELRSDPLPTLDLSLSLKSRFLSRWALDRMKKIMRWHRAITFASGIALAAYFVAVLVPVAYGRLFALVCISLWVPTVTMWLGLLRYEMVRLLLRSYDFWFCSGINSSTFFVLGLVMGGDERAFAPLAAWAGVQINLLIDANIRGVKVWAILNIVGVINCSLTWIALSLNLIDDVHEFPLLQYKSHALPASGFVASGLLTVTALVARNVYRKREVFFKRASRSVIECVSYRVNLRFEESDLQSQRAASTSLPPSDPTRPEYEKKMKYARRIGAINARCTVLQLLSQTHHPRCRSRHSRRSLAAADTEAGWLPLTSCQTTAFSWLGVFTIAVSICSVPVDIYVSVSRIPVCQLGALLLTIVYCSTCMLHYQRQLLRELCSTFDVIFLSAQLFVVHGSVCDIFEFGRGSVVVLISWHWFLWLLFLDSMPPIVKARLGVTKRFVLIVVVVLIGSSFGLIYLLVFADTSASVRDRELWGGRVLGMDLQIRLMPVFYNCFCTAFFLVLRILWRVVMNELNVLLMLDGAVIYENYLCTTRHRNSRRWGSIIRTIHSPRAGNFLTGRVLTQNPIVITAPSREAPLCE